MPSRETADRLLGRLDRLEREDRVRGSSSLSEYRRQARLEARGHEDRIPPSPEHAFWRGDLPGFRLYGRKSGPVRFRLADVEARLEAWRVNGPGAGGEVSPTPSGRPARAVVSQLSPTPDRE